MFAGSLRKGKSVKYFGDLLVYEIEEDKWTSINRSNVQEIPSERSGHSCGTSAGDSFVLFGGENYQVYMFDDVVARWYLL
jgi:N-acetylneuraminic acid mutarotase